MTVEDEEETLDSLFTRVERLEEELTVQLNRCDKELREGRTGYETFMRAKQLSDILAAEGRVLNDRMNEALKRLQ